VALVLTNTLSGRKEPLRARAAGHVRLYWCGVTVYSRAHVGHARFLVTADVLYRYLLARGLSVTFVRNLTDIEDKIIRRAAEEGIPPAALAEREVAAFAADVQPLGCLAPTHEPRATAHIPHMLALIETLVAKGFAYPVAGGSVYFRVGRFPDYGKLSHRRLEDMEAGEEIDRAPGEALRLLFHGTHYRAPVDFSAARLEEASRSLERFYEALARAEDAAGPVPAPVALERALAGTLSPFLTEFCAAMDDDLNAARGLGLVFDRLRELNRLLDAGDKRTAADVRGELRRAGAVLGIMTAPPAAFLEAARARGRERAGLSAAEIEAAIAAREEARRRKDFRAADAIRGRLREQGILLEDTPSGTVWRAG